MLSWRMKKKKALFSFISKTAETIVIELKTLLLLSQKAPKPRTSMEKKEIEGTALDE